VVIKNQQYRERNETSSSVTHLPFLGVSPEVQHVDRYEGAGGVHEAGAGGTQRHAVAQDLELTMLRDIVVSLGLYYDPKDEETVIEGDRDLITFYKLFEQRKLNEGASAAEAEADAATSGASEKAFSKWMLRLEFNRDAMFNRNITMDDVAVVLNTKFSDTVDMIYTDFNTEKLIMRIRLEDKDDAADDDYINFKKFQSQLLTTVAIRGVPGIKAASFSKSETRVEIIEGKPQKVAEYTIDTDGSNFIEVMNHPAVDPTRLYSTNVHDVIDILGIEAARATLLTEIDSLFADAGVNYRHLGLLIDTMTRNGRLMSVDRYAINKNNIRPLAKASFEETPEMFLKAARHADLDTMRGISANVMCGQEGFFGTSAFQVILNIEEMQKLDAASEYKPMDVNEEIEKFFGETDNQDKCSINNIAVQNNVITIHAEDMGADNDYNPGF
jgi:DNA-directed RNA polymerase II subunit RPB1